LSNQKRLLLVAVFLWKMSHQPLFFVLAQE
jgi:hypothetical protein